MWSCRLFRPREIKQREFFLFEEFLKQWELNKAMEKYTQFNNFISYKYSIPPEELNNDFTDFIKDQQDELTKSSVLDEFKTFIDHNEEVLQKKFDKMVKFRTNVRGIKCEGTYASEEEARLRAKFKQEEQPEFNHVVGPVGVWMPLDPDDYKTGEVEHMEEELNQLMHEKHKNDLINKSAFEQRVKEAKQKAIEDNIAKAEKSGNVLSQTIDEHGNLIGINSASTHEFALSELETVSTTDIQRQLFETGDVVTDKDTDHGQSLLQSGPFAK